MGHIEETKVVKVKIEILPCVKCESEDIEINDCRYNTFNVAWGKCKDCKHEVEFNCHGDIAKSEIVKVWNKANNPKILKKDYEKQIAELQKKINELPKK